MSCRRLLIGLVAAFALSLALAGQASARTVYDYAYSGTYIDGSDSGRTFEAGISGIAWDSHQKDLLVSNGGVDPTWIGKFGPNGEAIDFSGLASPIINLSGSDTNIGDPHIAVDQSGGPTEGNVYLDNGVQHGFKADGTPLVGYRQNQENSCGVAVNAAGEPITANRAGFEHFTPNGELLFSDYIGSPGLDPTIKVAWGERGRICRLVFDTNGDAFGIRPQDTFEPPSKVVKTNAKGLELFEVNPSQEGLVNPEGIFGEEEYEDPASTAVAIDSSDNDLFILGSELEHWEPNCPACWAPGGPGSFSLYDDDGRYLGGGYGAPEGGYLGITGGANGIAVDPETHDVWVANRRAYAGGVRRVEKFVRTNPHVIPDATATAPAYEDPTGESIKLQGTLNPDGVQTSECRFLIADSQTLLGNPDTRSVNCSQGQSFGGSADVPVSATISVTKGKRFWYRLASKNVDGYDTLSNPEKFLPQGKPKVEFLGVDRINTDGVRLRANIDPNGGNASYRFEWGQNGSFDHSTADSKTFGFTSKTEAFGGTNIYEPGVYEKSNLITELTPGGTYEYRLVVSDEAGTVTRGPQTFTTYVPDPGTDSCQNAQVRQQTEGSLLPDCRGYELVSARNQGGYDVESDIVPGQLPLQAYPRAQDRLLYSLHFGIIPGAGGSPTNHGLDPYVATRTAQGWTTRYVGIPADGMAEDGAFGSPLAGADSALDTFAFGGAEICAPCFDDGTTNVPLRLKDGSLVQGMAGSPNPPADPAGEVREPLSEDGSHFVFGAEKKFADGGPEAALGIYDRDLGSGSTRLVSTDPAGTALGGTVAELDISADGSHILVGRLVGEDSAGNKRYDLYMHIGGAAQSVLVADTPGGVVYNGMSGDGAQVFFTTTDALAGDGDTSADLYRADVGGSGTATVTRISTGIDGTGDTDACTPITDWNVVSGGPDCSTVAFAGGAGVAADGTVYFVSPEKLDGAANGEADQPNLYVVRPGQAPHFVGTIDSSLLKPGQQPPIHPPVTQNLITGLKEAEGMAINQHNGDIYVAEREGGGFVSRFTASGAAKKFTAPGTGSNRIANPGIGGTGESAIAVDSSGGAFDGSFYVTAGSNVNVYAESGASQGQISGFGYACGLAVDQLTGDLFVADYNGVIRRFAPINANGPVGNANYTETSISTAGFHPCHLSADSAGHVFAVNWEENGPLKKFDVADFAASPPTVEGEEVSKKSLASYGDASTGELYNNEGNKVVAYDTAGNVAVTIGSASSLGSNSLGVAVNESSKHVYALNGSNVVEFGLEDVPYRPIDQPGVVHGVQRSALHNYEDFQVTPNGRYAVFSSVVPLTGYINVGHSEIYRYDTVEERLECVSCAPSGAVGGSDVKLSGSGLNLTDDGRVFFTSRESFTLRDTNEKEDAYEWSNGSLGLISTGIGQYDSGLVTASADGKDAFFYTRETLSPEDENGKVVKIYTAREGGGYPFDPPRLPCAASDECHGAGTAAPAPPAIETETGSEVSPQPKSPGAKPCKKPRVKKHGKCVKKKSSKKKATKKKATSKSGRGGA